METDPVTVIYFGTLFRDSNSNVAAANNWKVSERKKFDQNLLKRRCNLKNSNHEIVNI